MKTIAITVDEGMVERLDNLARTTRGAGTRRNRSRVIREAIQEYVVRLEKEAQEEREAAILRKHRATLARQARAAVRAQAVL